MTDEERERLRAISGAAQGLNIVCLEALSGYIPTTHADLEAAWQRLLALRWQSMDSAPRGTDLLVSYPTDEFDKGCVVVSGWNPALDCHDYMLNIVTRPTAWMPLPPVKEVV